MLHANFNILKEFVEVEQAWSKYCWSGEHKSAPWFERHLPLYWDFKEFRRPDLGLEYLEWASTLDNPALPPHERAEGQAKAARETLALYIWWTKTRPARKLLDTAEYNDQGLGILGCLDEEFDRDAEDYKAHSEIMAKNSTLEEEWSNEDEEMLIRLIKVRGHLWT
jgi:hypothetical protein